MEDLASSEKYSKVNFVTISCSGPQHATVFASRLQLQHVVNTVATENPAWGQLGCSGYIILDKRGNVVCDKTMAFMEYQESAFENLMDTLDIVMTPGASTETIVERLQNMSKQETKTNANNNNNNTCSNGMCSLPTKNAKNEEAKKKISSCSSNNGGGCSNGNCSIEARNKSEEAVPELADIVSVQNAELDRQHRLCADALEQLRLKGDTSSLKEVLRCYKMHFEYEENLLDVHLYKDIIGEKNQSNGFSAADGARKSHYRDHERLISDIEKILSNIECNEEDNNPCLSSKFISEVLRNFERHANVYDDSYADALSSALQ